MTKTVYDIIGIGIGPFNLGMAALTDPIESLKCLFFDQNKEFNWHPGMMLDNARLQVPFYADLVTLADPCSRFSFMSFLKAKQRMFRFAILEDNFITRREYNEYCQWVAGQLSSLQFGYRCEAVRFDASENIYAVHVRDVVTQMGYVHYCKHLVIGVGMVSAVPECVSSLLTSTSSPHKEERRIQSDVDPIIIHSSDYLYFKERLLTKKSVAIIGSGQSAAEIFYDLLTASPLTLSTGGEGERSLNWFTRTERFMPMDYSKFALEMTSPDYIKHFYSLSAEKKKSILHSQDTLFKGINFSLIEDIYRELHQQWNYNTVNFPALYPNSELTGINIADDRSIKMSFYHGECNRPFDHVAEAVILATGYRYEIPAFLDPIKELILLTADSSTLRQTQDKLSSGQAQYQVNEDYSIDEGHSIFVQNAELHSHGFNAPDLGMGPYRNASILNSILGYECFVMERDVCFQKFGVPEPSPLPLSQRERVET
ncbi:MAG TPA: SidA/IucD/PvdA family monooxygenase [Chlamydiales bacterium]|nr:SidA/IucD/PvdA family monooxygenase [Chlamydiales bacterium]